MAINHLVTRIIDKRDKGLNLLCRPGFFHQTLTCLLGIWGSLDEFNNLVNRGQSHQQAGQNMRPIP